MAATDTTRILFVTPHNPWGRGGGCRATNIYLNAMLEIFPEAHFDICIYDRFLPFLPDDIAASPRISVTAATRRPLGRRLAGIITGEMHRFHNRVKALLASNTYRLCFFDKSHTAGTLLSLVPRGTHTVTLHHNFEPDYFRVEEGSFMFHLLFGHHIRRLEKRAYLRSRTNLFLTDEDARQFRSAYGTTEAACLVSGMFEPSRTDGGRTATGPEPDTAVIAGSLNNRQNLDGLKHFFSRLYPLLPPGYRIIVAGQKPSPEVRELCAAHHNVELVADPPSLADVIARAEIAICPTRKGSGMKIRLTDPLKAGIPVIAHATSGRGYAPFISKEAMLTYTTPAGFADTFTRMRAAIGSGQISRNAISELYSAIFSHEKGIRRLKSVLTGN